MGEGTGCSNTRADLWGTEGSNPLPSSGESPANLSFRRIEVQGRSREADGDSRGGEHQGCAAVQHLTASPAADATESNVSLSPRKSFGSSTGIFVMPRAARPVHH